MAEVMWKAEVKIRDSMNWRRFRVWEKELDGEECVRYSRDENTLTLTVLEPRSKAFAPPGTSGFAAGFTLACVLQRLLDIFGLTSMKWAVIDGHGKVSKRFEVDAHACYRQIPTDANGLEV